MSDIELSRDNSRNTILASGVPIKCKNEPCMLGIDEAGRGPVLGPMVYAAAYCPITSLAFLKDKGFADSKTLTEEKRDTFFDLINDANDVMGWLLEVHSPNTISNSMLQRCKYNLNALSHDSAIMLVKRALASGVNVTELYVDTVGPAEKYQAKLSSLFPDIKVTVAKQADSVYPIVSAASICAKVTRDKALKTWTFTEGEEFETMEYGSGYPNDPATKKFLSENIDPVFGFPQIVRFSWSTADKILEDKAIEVAWEECDEPPNEKNNKTVPILNFIKKRKLSSDLSKPKNTSFFTQRNLSQVVQL